MQEPLFGTGDPIEAVLAALQKVPGYPYEVDKDTVLVRDLLDSFPQLDLVEEIRGWSAWMLDHQSKTKQVNRRARLRRWCGQAVEFRRRSGGPGGRPSSSAPAPPEAFGTETVRLDDW